MMNTKDIRTAQNEDIKILTEIFWNNLVNNPSYISHGEIQMGVGSDISIPAKNGKEKWQKYVTGKIEGEDSVVYIFNKDGKINGFIIASIEEDGDAPYGVLCDILVLPEDRGKGIGDTLMKAGMDWLKSRNIEDVYLESGKENHSAHLFFEKRGFEMVSHVYKLKGK